MLELGAETWEGRAVVRGVCLKVRAGEQVALVGRTGAGKTSLLHLIGGALLIAAGLFLVLSSPPSQPTRVEVVNAPTQGAPAAP